MPPNSREEESPTEQKYLLRNENRYEDLEQSVAIQNKIKKSGGPDGCRAWTVAFANFFINFVVVGLGRMSGILYIVFMYMFHIDRQTASMPFSIQQAARNFFGPLAGILGQKYGVRNVTILGGIIGTISTAACYFAMEMNWITILWGLAFGVCTALTTTLNQVPIDQYFEKHRTTAGGFAFSGGGVAAFIFPVVLETLISYYGMKRTFLIMAVFIFLVVPASLILVKPPWLEDSEDLVEEKLEKSKLPMKPVSYNTFESKVFEKDTKRNTMIPIDFNFLKQNCEFVFQLFYLTMPDEVVLAGPFTETLWNFSDTLPLVEELEDLYRNLQQDDSSNTIEATAPMTIEDELNHSIHVVEVNINGVPKQNSTDFADLTKENNSSDIVSNVQNVASYHNNPRLLFLSTKLQELCQFKKRALLLYFPSNVHVDIIRILEMLKTLNDMRVEKDESVNNNNSAVVNAEPKVNDELLECRRRVKVLQSKKQSNSFMVHIKTALKLHTNPLFLLICLCRGVFMLTFIPLVTIIVDFAMDKGLRKTSGKYIISILSLGDLIGRLCLGWINDIGCLSLPKYMLLAMLLLSISIATLPLMTSELSLMPAVLIFGMLEGSLFIRHQALISNYMNKNEQAIGMGFINFLSGFIGFALPFYIGYFRDTLGSYDNMFYLNGAICAVVGILWIFEPFLIKNTSKAKYETIPGNA